MKDKLFFFGAINPSWETRTFQAPNNQDADGNYQFPLYTQGGIDRKREITSYSGKATCNLTRTTTSTRRSSATRRTAQRPAAHLGAARAGHVAVQRADEVRRPQPDGELQRRPLAELVVEATYSHATNEIDEMPSVDTLERHRLPRRARTSTTGGIGFYEQGNDGENSQYRRRRRPSSAATSSATASCTRDRLRQHQPAHGPDVHGAERPGQTATGAQIQILPEITGLGQIYRVVARATSSRRTRPSSTTATSSCRTPSRSAIG